MNDAALWWNERAEHREIRLKPRQNTKSTDGVHAHDEAGWLSEPKISSLPISVAVVGHSMGGIISANIAALAKSAGLPVMRALMSVEPAKTWAKSDRINITLEDMNLLPSSTLMLVVTGDADNIAKDIDAKRIFNESKSVPGENKNFVTMVSDSHGTPALSATHFAPVSPNTGFGEPQAQEHPEVNQGIRGKIRERLKERVQERQEQSVDEEESVNRPERTDALDYYGLWKLFDGLINAAFSGTDRSYALGNTKEQRSMGAWSDGIAVKELLVVSKPPA